MKYMHTILPYLLSTLISGAATAQDVKLHKGCDCPTIRLDDAYCASSVSAILSGIPGFEHITRSMSPKRLMRDFAELPGVTTDKIYEDD